MVSWYYIWTGVHLCSQDFALCVKYRMGSNIYKEGAVCNGCKKEMDRGTCDEL